MSRKLNDLHPKFKPLAVELIARIVENGICVLIVNTFRTPEEQATYLAKGTSWVKHSKHQDGMAIDIVPYEIYNAHGLDKLDWDSSDPIWTKIGNIGESLGVGWGGRWTKKDMGHFELMEM